jgi:hypothetical protein
MSEQERMLEARMKISHLRKTMVDADEDENEAAEQGNQAKSADLGDLRLISVLGLVSTQARSKELI